MTTRVTQLVATTLNSFVLTHLTDFTDHGAQLTLVAQILGPLTFSALHLMTYGNRSICMSQGKVINYHMHLISQTKD